VNGDDALPRRSLRTQATAPKRGCAIPGGGARFQALGRPGTTNGTGLVKDIDPNTAAFFADSNPLGLTDVNGTLFFAADDGTHGFELWKSDGTSAGTTLVKDIYPGPGPFDQVSGPGDSMDQLSLTNVSGTLFFFADDGVHGFELWKSDGTAGGTVIVKDINPGSASSDLQVQGSMLAVNGILYFGANDGTGDALWRSDGTQAGTFKLADDYDRFHAGPGIVAVGGLASINAGHFGDFDNDGKDDVLWRNDNGSVAIWQMNGSVITPHFLQGVSSDWHIAGTGDFDGDHHADILWLNDNGSVLEWQMTSSAGFGPTQSVGTAPANSTLAGVGDVSGDGKADILWRDNGSGAVTIWKMNGGTIAATGTVSGVGNDWALVGLGDLTGDGKADVVFRNLSSGVVAHWSWPGAANPLSDAPTTTFLSGVPLNWHVVGLGDFDSGGTTDLFWHNDNGANAVWLMGSNGQVQQAAFFSGVGPDWQVVGTGDVNGDHKDDVIWRSDNGATAIWQMNGAGAPTVSFPGGVPSDWGTQTHHYDYV